MVSDDDGASWQTLAVPEDVAGNLVALAADSRVAGRLDLVGAFLCPDVSFICDDRFFELYHSDSAGADWRWVSTVDAGYPLFTVLKIHPVRGRTCRTAGRNQ